MPTLALAVILFATPAADRPLAVPSGFTVTRVAGPVLVRYPVVGDFDVRGRLYVIDMAGPVNRGDVTAKKPLHRVVRLEDADGDGVFDKAVTFADALPFPEGVLWLNGSLLVAAPPHILKLTDTDGDGVADKREVWFDGQTLTGCANDLHGPYRGPDGYVYWCKGAFAEQKHTLPNGKKFVSKAAHIFRAKPDGTGVEPVMTGGMDNPVGLAFTPGGERIFSTTFFQHPANGRRDGLVHAVYGGVYGKDHAPVYDHPWTAPHLMPVLTHLGPAAPAGLKRYESDQFGPEYRDNLFCAQFNLRTVSRHVLVPKGSTFETLDSPFVTSTDADFHPTDVIEDTDGSLLVIDTGGWYKLCCPSSQLVPADAFGGIYRVKKTGSHTARTKPAARPLPRLYDIALKRDKSGLAEAVAALSADDRHTRRLAAEALGRIGNPSAVPPLLVALADETNDRVLDHSLTYALIEIGDAKTTAVGLTHPSPRVKRAALAALDGMGNTLTAADVTPHLTAAAPALRETAWWVAGRHPKWAEQVVGVLRAELAAADKFSPTAREELATRAAKFAGNAKVQEALGELLAEAKSADTRVLILRAMAGSKLKAFPDAWQPGVASALAEGNDASRAALTVLKAVPPTVEQYNAVAYVALNKFDGQWQSDIVLSLTALGLPYQTHPGTVVMDAILSQLGRDRPAANRAAALDGLTRAKLTTDNLTTIAAALKTVGPVELPHLIDLFARSKDEAVGLALVSALNDPAVRPMVRAEQVKPVLDAYPPAVRAAAERLYAELDKARAGERVKLDEVLGGLKGGDAVRGRAVFNGAKAACATCHTIGYVGGKLGPDLTTIGKIRSERDLLESVLFPSASFVRSYEPVKVSTADGREFNGILKADTAEEVVLAVAADKEVRIPRGEVERMVPGSVSVMPAGLDQQLTRQELADLIAFLKACR